MFQEKLKSWLDNQLLPEAMLWDVPIGLDISLDLLAFAKRFFCTQGVNAACNTCQDCRWIDSKSHPDCLFVTPETPRSVIKIDAIRQVQAQSYQTAFRGRGRLIIIQPAEDMNLNAANALLKVLEEPAKGTHFILITTAVYSLPLTIKSRCVKYTFAPSISPLLQVMLEVQADWNDVLTMKKSVCAVVQHWLKHPFLEVVHTLYLLVAEAIKGKQTLNINLFYTLDKLSAIIKKTRAHIAMNEALALEDILISSMVSGNRHE